MSSATPFVLGANEEQTTSLVRICGHRSDVLARAHITYGGEFLFIARTPSITWPENGDALLTSAGTPFAVRESLLAYVKHFLPFDEASKLIGVDQDLEVQRRLDLYAEYKQTAKETGRLAQLESEARDEAHRMRLVELRANTWDGLKPEKRLAYNLAIVFEELGQPGIAKRIRTLNIDSLPPRPWW